MRALKICVAIFVIMILLPYLSVKLLTDAGMMAALILFYAVNPVFSLIVGVLSANSFRRHWYLGLLSAVAFLVGTASFFTAYEPLFLLYAGAYALLSYIAAAVCKILTK